MASEPVPLSTTLSYIQKQLIRYVHSCFLVFGVTGCCLNILLLSRRQFRTSSCCTYLLAMTVAMVTNLSFSLGMQLYTLDHVDPNTELLPVCKLRIYILQFTGLTYRWLLSAACFDRYALSAVNVRLRNLAKIHIARRVIATIPVLALILSIHILFLYNLRGNVCGIVYSVIGAFYHSIFVIIFSGVLPVMIMTTCSLLIYRNLVQKQRRRQQLNFIQEHTNQAGRLAPQSRRDQQVLLMLLVQVAVYLILVTPLLCWQLYSAITLNVSNKSSDRLAIERFFMFMTDLTLVGFPVSSFYLYTMASQMFRAELKMMIRAAFTCQWANPDTRITPATNDIAINTATEHVQRSKPAVPSSSNFNREKLQGTVMTVEQVGNVDQQESSPT